MWKSKLLGILTVLLTMGFHSPILQAQETDTEKARQEKIENDIRKIGLSAGYAAQCYLSKEDQESAEKVAEEALSVAEIILQDFGSTLAFLFSSNAGYGRGKPIDLEECDDLIGDWDDFVERLSEEQEK